MFKVYDADHEYIVEKFPNQKLLCVQRDGIKRFVKVKEDYEFTYCIQKTQIKANGGVEGLYKFMSENKNLQDLFWCRVRKICENVFDYMKEARI